LNLRDNETAGEFLLGGHTCFIFGTETSQTSCIAKCLRGLASCVCQIGRRMFPWKVWAPFTGNR